MPISSEMVLPKTRDASEFEDMICDVCTKKYKREFQRYGRSGQKQNGIDIISDEKEMICVQCKNFKLSIKIVEKIINDAENFTFSFKEFIIATSSPRDNKLQDYVEEINNNNNKYRFIIKIMFWDEITTIVVSHKKLYKKYYLILLEKSKKTIKKLVKKFNKCINQYHIINFVQEDIYKGIPIDAPNDVTDFINELTRVLIEYNFLQQKIKFKSIKQFVEELGRYSTYISAILYPAGSNLVMQNQLQKDNFEKDILPNINDFKEKMNVLYGQINNGDSMFVVDLYC